MRTSTKSSVVQEPEKEPFVRLRDRSISAVGYDQVTIGPLSKSFLVSYNRTVMTWVLVPMQILLKYIFPFKFSRVSESMFFSLVSIIVYYHCQSHPRMFSHWVNHYVFNACIDLINHEPKSHSPVHDLCLWLLVVCRRYYESEYFQFPLLCTHF